MSHYYAKQMFLSHLESGYKSYTAIRAKIKVNYSQVDVKKIRDELEEEGLIELSHKGTRKSGKETKTEFFYQLCEPKLAIKQEKPYDPLDITLPSSIFTKQEKANMMATLRMLENKSNKKLKKMAEIKTYGEA